MSVKNSKRCCLFLILLLLCSAWMPVMAAGTGDSAQAYVLMEATSGTVIQAHNEDQPMHGAGITKLMSYLLFFEALQSGTVKPEDIVTVSKDAASKGGTSAFLDAGETHSFADLLKAAVVCSANDATCALAEHLAGSEAAFTELMNAQAVEMQIDAVFADCTGLSSSSLVSAYAFSRIASALSKYNTLFEYSSCWTYTFVHNSGRETEITNANTLVRDGSCDGMATGSTAESGYHMAASAKSGGARFVFVILGAKDAASRATAAKQSISEAVATYGVKQVAQKGAKYKTVPIGEDGRQTVDVFPCEDLILLYKKGEEQSISVKVELEELVLPLAAGQVVGRIVADTAQGQNSVALEVRDAAEEVTVKKSVQRILYIWLKGL